MIQVIIYGDSIMKGATPEGASKYRSVLPRFLPRLAEKYDLAVTNRSRFGCTIDRGYAMLQKDLQEKTPCQIALVEYGGNDCDFDWKAIAADPTGEHKPKTSIESFVKTLETMAENLLQRNIQPLLMTLPPVDASRYLSFICRDGLNRANIIQWLGGGEQMIYRYQELYSAAIMKLALRRRFPVVDVRSYFLDKHNYGDLISADGIHPSEAGYALIHRAFDDYLQGAMAERSVPGGRRRLAARGPSAPGPAKPNAGGRGLWPRPPASGCRKSGLRHFVEVFIAPLRLRRGQGAMQGHPCYARLFADLPYMPPNPMKA